MHMFLKIWRDVWDWEEDVCGPEENLEGELSDSSWYTGRELDPPEASLLSVANMSLNWTRVLEICWSNPRDNE